MDSKLINNSQFGGKPVSRLGSVLDHCIKQQRFINELPSLLILRCTYIVPTGWE